MATERISQILPTVKCSDCGRDVLIRRLGDHLCTSQPPVPSLPIIPQAKASQFRHCRAPMDPVMVAKRMISTLPMQQQRQQQQDQLHRPIIVGWREICNVL
ncbi:hypothetical protein G6F42_017144 [Rhizopus arrhizus]|nr:hypothetical protein G6F42_017144 [Rhizopus arrhizus]